MQSQYCPKHSRPGRPMLRSRCGCPVATEPPAAKRGRGRPPKFTSEEDRKTADATRKRNERLVKKAEQIIAENPDSKGSHGELTGGNVVAVKVDKIAATEILRSPSNPEVLEVLESPDRKRIAPKPSVDSFAERADNKETETTFITLAFRRSARALEQWTNWGKIAPRVCPNLGDHSRWACEQRDSKRKVYCGKCKKLLVNPGKKVRGIQPYTPNIPDAAPKASDAV